MQTENPFLKCASCPNSEKIQKRITIRNNPLIYTSKKHTELRTVFKCRLNHCTLKEV